MAALVEPSYPNKNSLQPDAMVTLSALCEITIFRYLAWGEPKGPSETNSQRSFRVLKSGVKE